MSVARQLKIPPHGDPAKGLLGELVVLARHGGILRKAARTLRMARLCWRHLAGQATALFRVQHIAARPGGVNRGGGTPLAALARRRERGGGAPLAALVAAA